MQPSEDEPLQQQIEALVTDEERQALQDSEVPDDVKSEIMERLRRFREADMDQIHAEDARNTP